MEIASLPFAGFAVAAVLAYNAVRIDRGRQLVLLAANLIFIANFAATPQSLVPIAAFVLLGFLALRAVENSMRLGTVTAAIVIICGVFIYVKRYTVVEFVPGLPFVYLLVGVSYILFRILHLLVDRYQGSIETPISALNYLNYTLFFPAFVSGPLQRYQDFIGSPLARELDKDRVFGAFSRVLSGYVKIFVISPIFLAAFNKLLGGITPEAVELDLAIASTYGAAACAFYIHFYFSFQGYMDVVIGIANLMGIRLPENFKNPFVARNFLDFWSRWHITLAAWFRTYLFNPLLKALIRMTGWRKGSNYLAVLAFFVSFLIMGIWHGTTELWVRYGLLLAAGVSINKLYQVVSGAILGRRRYTTLCDNRFYAALAVGMTFAYVSLAFSAFWPDQGLQSVMNGALGISTAVVSFAMLSVTVGFIYLSLNPSLSALKQSLTNKAIRFDGVITRNTWLAVKLSIIVAAALLGSAIPESVYKPF